MIPAFLMSRLAGPIASAVAVALMVATIVLGVNLGVARHELRGALAREATSNQALGTCRGGAATLEAAIADGNSRLAAMQDDAVKREADRKAADIAINAALADRAAALKAAKPGVDKCASAAALIKGLMK